MVEWVEDEVIVSSPIGNVEKVVIEKTEGEEFIPIVAGYARGWGPPPSRRRKRYNFADDKAVTVGDNDEGENEITIWNRHGDTIYHPRRISEKTLRNMLPDDLPGEPKAASSSTNYYNYGGKVGQQGSMSVNGGATFN
ncbi:hypothetical protein ABW20_dc0102518 [Dactylellina cionopaga]|nr:hypothetical protein ABW20_dc0102518 [Dactylellina cionopaga]